MKLSLLKQSQAKLSICRCILLIQFNGAQIGGHRLAVVIHVQMKNSRLLDNRSSFICKTKLHMSHFRIPWRQPVQKINICVSTGGRGTKHAKNKNLGPDPFDPWFDPDPDWSWSEEEAKEEVE